MNEFIVAVDGPAASGKSTLSQSLARWFGFLYISSGAIYRAIGYKAFNAGIDLDGDAIVAQIAQSSYIKLEGTPDDPQIILDAQDISNVIQTPEITWAATCVASLPMTRRVVIEILRDISLGRSVIMDGRDIGTNVFPNAQVKLFIDASLEVRSHRRWKEESQRGRDSSIEQIKTELAERDQRDRERKVNPLLQANDAILIDTSGLPAEVVLQVATEIINKVRGSAKF